ncbi:hypothetical protein Leryth_023760 [Lithospermum erythrorhizon]|nr:hypothetical protein Leryth_023760 [Lithospermum erythrorhizon]
MVKMEIIALLLVPPCCSCIFKPKLTSQSYGGISPSLLLLVLLFPFSIFFLKYCSCFYLTS